MRSYESVSDVLTDEIMNKVCKDKTYCGAAATEIAIARGMRGVENFILRSVVFV